MQIIIPSSDEIALAPELATVAVALAALLAVRRALEAAHPVLLFPDSAIEPTFDDCEHAAACAVLDADALIGTLAVYARVASRANQDMPDDDSLF